MIAFFLQNTGSLYGAERATLELARHVQAKGPGVCIYLITETRLGLKESPLVDYCRTWNLACTEFPVESAFSRSLIQTLRTALVSDGVKILHTVGYKPTFHGGWAVRSTGVHHVSTVHGWLFRKNIREKVYGCLERWMLKRCARVIVLSRFYEDLLLRYGFDPDRVNRIPTGIELTEPRERPSAESENRTVFGFAGRFSEEKRPEDFIRAAEKCIDEGVKADFFLAGDGPLRAPLQASLKKEEIHMLGFVSASTLFEKLDVLVNTSQVENLPYSILEAMSRGLPVIASDVGGTPDAVEPNRTGLLYPAGDLSALVKCMKRLAEDPDLRLALGRAARAKVEKEFGLDRCVQEHIKLYHTLTASAS